MHRLEIGLIILGDQEDKNTILSFRPRSFSQIIPKEMPMPILNKDWSEIVLRYDVQYQTEYENDTWLHKFDAFQLVKRVRDENLADSERQDSLDELVQGIHLLSVFWKFTCKGFSDLLVVIPRAWASLAGKSGNLSISSM